MALRTGRGEAAVSAAMRMCGWGFTLIELLAVMAILATLLSIAAPRYFESVDRAKEATLRTDLRVLREAIDKYKGDHGQLPDSLQGLVDQRYIRAVPLDPVTDTATDWMLVPHPDGVTVCVFALHLRNVMPAFGIVLAAAIDKSESNTIHSTV
jgi:general secretion pathway protein G